MLICGALLQAQGQQWTQDLEDQLCYEVKTLLLAGHETSASMLTWSIFELIQNPAAREQVRFAVRCQDGSRLRTRPGAPFLHSLILHQLMF